MAQVAQFAELSEKVAAGAAIRAAELVATISSDAALRSDLAAAQSSNAATVDPYQVSILANSSFLSQSPPTPSPRRSSSASGGDPKTRKLNNGEALAPFRGASVEVAPKA